MATAPEITVILADRNRHVREFLARELTRSGFSVKSTGSGREAAELAAREGDVLVVDGDLPDLEAAGVVRRLRQARPGMPVAVHAHDKDEAGDCLGDPLVFFVPKAEDPAGLIRAIRTVADSERTGSREGQGPGRDR